MNNKRFAPLEPNKKRQNEKEINTNNFIIILILIFDME